MQNGKSQPQPQLSPKDLGRVVGVSESSIKRWIDDGRILAQKTAGGHRRIEVADALEFVRRSGMTIQDPRPLGFNSLDQGLEEDELRRQLQRVLEEGDAAQAENLMVAAYSEGASLAGLVDGPMAGAMHRIGEIWKHDSRGLHVEHRATDICVRILNRLHSLIPEPGEEAPVAVGCAPSKDPYMLPSLAASCVLRSEGWNTVNFGPDLPLRALAEAAGDMGARLAWVSVSSPLKGDDLDREVEDLAGDLADRNAFLILGGRSLPARMGLELDNVQRVVSMAELGAFARGLVAREH